MADASTEAIEQRARRAAELIDDADALIIGAGAGMGVDSGLPDFRGDEGFWRAYPALAKAQINFQAIASPDAFRDAPTRAWGFYAHRLALYRRTMPHVGFSLLKRLGDSMPHGCFVFTSNVDGQFQKAGFEARRIVECHGSLHHLQCLEPCCQDIWSASDFVPEIDDDACTLVSDPPVCHQCGKLARPNVLLFGDWAWVEMRQQSQQIRLEQWLATVRRPVVVELGAGTAIPSVRHFTQRIVHMFDTAVIRINPREAAVPSYRDVSLPVGAAVGVRAIAAALERPGRGLVLRA